MTTLNQQVAAAMGWTNIRSDGVFYPDGADKPGFEDLIGIHPVHHEEWVVPHYDTDYAALPEMLAWLCGRSRYKSFNAGCWTPGQFPWLWTAIWHYFPAKPESGPNISGHGQTLPAAVAKLVVAVAEAQKQ